MAITDVDRTVKVSSSLPLYVPFILCAILSIIIQHNAIFVSLNRSLIVCVGFHHTIVHFHKVISQFRKRVLLSQAFTLLRNNALKACTQEIVDKNRLVYANNTTTTFLIEYGPMKYKEFVLIYSAFPIISKDHTCTYTNI